MNRRSIFKLLFAAPIAAVAPRPATASHPIRELGDLALQVSRVLAAACDQGDIATVEGAQRLFWGIQGLEPALAPEIVRKQSLHGTRIVSDEFHEHDPIKAGEFIRHLRGG